MKKKYFLLFLILYFCSSFVVLNVNAAEKLKTTTTIPKKCKDEYSESQIKQNFAVKMETKNHNGYIDFTYKFKPVDKYKNIEMKINVTKGTVLNNKTTIKGDDSFVVRVKTGKNEFDTDYDLTISGKVEKKDGLDCEGEISFHLGGESYAGTKENESYADIVVNKGGNTEKINCDSPKDRNEIIICDAKEYSKNKTKKFDADTSKNNMVLQSFKCNVNSFLDATKLTNVDFYNSYSEYTTHLSDLYYQNREYLYGYSVDKIVGQTYKYNFDPENETPGVTPSCKRTCEEGVVVEYGPPIASKAGLCFEYKIRVTSSVRCYSDLDSIVEPKKITSVCTPGPTCTGIGQSGTPYAVTEGGPNKDFDKCINSCDGGKYTKKCSTKCYKKVYGSTDKTSNNRDSVTDIMKLSDDTSDEIKNCAEKSTRNHGGCYVRSNGSIVWKNVVKNTRGRWYVTSGWNKSGYSVFLNDGFMRHDYGGGEFCHDNCSWNTYDCDENEYLNYGYSESDYIKNMEYYSKLVDDCKAAASCSTKTATFTISVDYKDSKNTKYTIDFPYSGKKDKIPSNNSSNTSSTVDDDNSTIINEPAPNGCYLGKNKKAQFYQVAWSFPGSWINNKTGEVSYVKKDTNSGWRTIKNKFCLPLDAQNVNMTWWNTYYGRLLSSSEYYDKSSTNSEEAKDNCKIISSSNSIYKYKQSYDNDDDITYNIHGQTEEFGHFGWKINVSCFYALNTNPVIEEEKNSDGSTNIQCKTSNEAKVRAVDLTNLFPATDGSATTDSSKTGRTPGFNWSTYATIRPEKNSGYTSSPATYLAEVQNLGYSVYSNKYLDYEFELDKNKLSELKKKSGTSNNYTNYNGSFRTGEKSGVSRYTSDIISDYASKKAREGDNKSLDCNNVENFESTECKKAE